MFIESPTSPKTVAIALAIASSIAATSDAAVFVSTGHTGAQVQCDYQHFQHWTYSVSEDVTDISGALFTMKSGSQTTAAIDFVIFEGTYSDYGSATNLLSVTLGPDAFTTQFTPVMFSSTAITLIAGHTYTAVLASHALDPQSEAYFIKGGSESPLSFVGPDGVRWTGGGQITPPTPAPGVAALFALAGFACRPRRRAE